MVERDGGFNRDIIGTTGSLCLQASGHLQTFVLLEGVPLLCATISFLLALSSIFVSPSNYLILLKFTVSFFGIAQVVVLYYVLEVVVRLYLSVRSGEQLNDEAGSEPPIEYHGPNWEVMYSINPKDAEYLAKSTFSFIFVFLWTFLISIRFFRSITTWLDSAAQGLAIDISVSEVLSFLDYFTRIQLSQIINSMNAEEVFLLIVSLPALLMSFILLLNLRRFLSRMFSDSYRSTDSVRVQTERVCSDFLGIAWKFIQAVAQQREDAHVLRFGWALLQTFSVLALYFISTYWILTL